MYVCRYIQGGARNAIPFALYMDESISNLNINNLEF